MRLAMDRCRAAHQDITVAANITVGVGTCWLVRTVIRIETVRVAATAHRYRRQSDDETTSRCADSRRRRSHHVSEVPANDPSKAESQAISAISRPEASDLNGICAGLKSAG